MPIPIFASAYAPVDALSTRELQLNSELRARQMESQRLAAAQQQAQMQAVLQARQIQDNQAARAMQTAMDSRKQFEIENQNRLRLVENDKDRTAREKSYLDQMEHERFLQKQREEAQRESEKEKRKWIDDYEKQQKDALLKKQATDNANRANFLLDQAVRNEILKDKSHFWNSDRTDQDNAETYMGDPANKADILKRRKRLKSILEKTLPSESFGPLKWNEMNTNWESRLDPESSIGPFNGIGGSSSAPNPLVMPPPPPPSFPGWTNPPRAPGEANYGYRGGVLTDLNTGKPVEFK